MLRWTFFSEWSWHPFWKFLNFDFWKSSDHIHKQGFIFGLFIQFHWSMCQSLCQYHSFDYYNFIVSFEISKRLSALLFSIKIVLAILGFFEIPYYFKMSFSVAKTNAIRILMGITLNLRIAWVILISFFFFFLVAPRCLGDLSSPTRDQTQAPVRENKNSQPLDHQGILYIVILTILSLPVHEHGISFHLFVSLISLISVL